MEQRSKSSRTHKQAANGKERGGRLLVEAAGAASERATSLHQAAAMSLAVLLQVSDCRQSEWPLLRVHARIRAHECEAQRAQIRMHQSGDEEGCLLCWERTQEECMGGMQTRSADERFFGLSLAFLT